jgi:CheY-like chemotaxis protein
MLERAQKTVLVVEDDAGLRAVIADCLELDDYAVIQASNGDEAMHLARLNPPDVILLDLAMPHRSGLQVLQALKGAAPTRDIPVVIVSGYALVLMGNLTPRVDGVIQKPFDVDVLLAQVKRASAGRAISGR